MTPDQLDKAMELADAYAEADSLESMNVCRAPQDEFKVLCINRQKARVALHDYLLSTAQPKQEPLTDEQIMDATRNLCTEFRWPSTAIDIARAIESAHGIGDKA